MRNKLNDHISDTNFSIVSRGQGQFATNCAMEQGFAGYK